MSIAQNENRKNIEGDRSYNTNFHTCYIGYPKLPLQHIKLMRNKYKSVKMWNEIPPELRYI